MKTRQDFLTIVDQTADKYDQLAALRRAGDPRYFQLQDAIATMMAEISQQTEVAMMEPFDKVRDATVLADAALKGIIPKSTPARVTLTVKNTNTASAFNMAAGRRVTDSSGNFYEVDQPVTVPKATNSSTPGVATVVAVQRTVRTVTHTVTESVGFYAIEVPPSQDGRYLSGLQVSDSNRAAYTFAPAFVNVLPDAKVFHVETDAYQRMYVKFGLSGVVGYQPAAGEQFTITITESNGDVRPVAGSPFNLEYAYTPADSMITVEFASLTTVGTNPIGITELRELCRYPSTYNDSAVFMGEFDFLVRKNIVGLPFLSIWNEQIEEKVRGASVDNINALFVSFTTPEGSTQQGTFDAITALINAADDSYRIKYVAPVVSEIGITITASVARIHDPEAVKQQIKDVVLAEYGRGSPSSKRGMQPPQYKRINDILRANIAALQDAGSDFGTVISTPTTALVPENWRYVSTTSLVVNVQAKDTSIESWGG